MRRLPLLLAATTALAAVPAHAQFHEPDPEATEAFETLVASYRARPALTVRSTVSVEVREGEMASGGKEVTGELVFADDGRGVFRIRGFTCHLGGGTFSAVHEATDHSYFSTPDDDAPYYALLNAFVDLPYPHLAIAFGEPDIEDLCMQFHPKAPWVRPTAVEPLEDGTGRRIILTSDFSRMVVETEDERGLIRTVDLEVSGGALVQPGSTLVYHHEFEYDETPPEAGTFDFDPGDRQRVDLLAALMPKARPAERPQLAAGGNELVGQPAPPLVLTTIAGPAVDLADWEGQVVILDFWATWCGPCRAALPRLHEVAAWADREQLPVQVLTVNVWESRGGEDTPEARLATASKFWKTQGFTLPVAMDYSDEVVKSYGVRGIPATVVIRADGVVHAMHTGAGPDYEQMLQDDIRAAMEAVEAE
ncbi:MAG: TlpA family protein disulfide reductase [Planctomycetota bacterium]|jgi:thiol-disulfide isomerase/thioredoxin